MSTIHLRRAALGITALGLALTAGGCAVPDLDAGQNRAAPAASDAPLTRCGAEIAWAAQTAYAPEGARTIISWAYNQTAPVTHTAASSRAIPPSVVWEWQHSMSGGPYRPGQTYQSKAILGSRTYWTHGLDGAHDQPAAVWRQRTLRQVVADFGVDEPSSTAAGLSEADRHALTAICAKGEAARAAGAGVVIGGGISTSTNGCVGHCSKPTPGSESVVGVGGRILD